MLCTWLDLNSPTAAAAAAAAGAAAAGAAAAAAAVKPECVEFAPSYAPANDLPSYASTRQLKRLILQPFHMPFQTD
jgi:hypothetical protein